ncbi:MAG: VIT domain-containing protein [Gemmatimonas sp.]
MSTTADGDTMYRYAIKPNHDLAPVNAAPAGLGGLRAHDGRAFPLLDVKVRASFAGPCGRTIVEQHFANPFDETLDVTWIFPLPDTGAITELELHAGDIRVVGECHEKAEAKAIFDDARTSGKRAALVEKEQGHVHTLSLAGLPARSHVTVRYTLVELLPSVDGRFRWQFPTTIAPRYTPGTPVSHDGIGTEPDTDFVPNASRLTPPVRLEGGTKLDLEVEIAGPVSALESSLHAVRMNMISGAVRVAPSSSATLNKDFILEFSTADRTTTSTRAWTDGVHTLVLVEPPTDQSAKGLQRDAVFAVDISGSMDGQKLIAAKAALLGALHGLREGDRFKLIAFDDQVECFSRDFTVYNDVNLQAADRWVESLQSRGGTEMLEAIQESLTGATPVGRLRTVLFITDGQSNDEARLLPAVANRKGNALFFTLGIDTAVNTSLLKALARAGGGVCELCTPYDDIDAIVARLEVRFGAPLMSNIVVAGAARPDAQTVFAGRPAALLVENTSSSVHIAATDANGAFATDVVPQSIGFSLGALWAMERVQWLEECLTLRPFEEEAIRPEIVRVALAAKITSRFTSFVCVDHSTINSGEQRHVVQPVEYPDAWELAERAPGGGMAMPAMAPMPFPGPMRSRSAPMLFSSRAGSMRRADMESDIDSASDSSAYADYDDASVIEEVQEMLSEPHEPESALPDGTTRSFQVREAIDGLFDQAKKAFGGVGGTGSPSDTDVRGESSKAGTLARSQSANGSFGDDVQRTCAALVALLLLGHTRKKGDRRRTVEKAAEWLQKQQQTELITLSLGLLLRVEQGGEVPRDDAQRFVGDSVEGRMLQELIFHRSLVH